MLWWFLRSRVSRVRSEGTQRLGRRDERKWLLAGSDVTRRVTENESNPWLCS